jgi:hypothetical protein
VCSCYPACTPMHRLRSAKKERGSPYTFTHATLPHLSQISDLVSPSLDLNATGHLLALSRSPHNGFSCRCRPVASTQTRPRRLPRAIDLTQQPFKRRLEATQDGRRRRRRWRRSLRRRGRRTAQAEHFDQPASRRSSNRFSKADHCPTLPRLANASRYHPLVQHLVRPLDDPPHRTEEPPRVLQLEESEQGAGDLQGLSRLYGPHLPP